MCKHIWIVTLLTLLLAGCGEDADRNDAVVRDHIDGLLKAGIEDLPGRWLPGPDRERRLYPDEDRSTPRSRGYLGKSPDGRALLALDQAAVPALVALLPDARRRTLAVVFLGEIGGPDAASALLQKWRGLRDNTRAKRAYIDNGGMRLVSTMYETPDDQLVPALAHSLSLCGLPVTKEIAADTLAAMNEAEALQRDGAAVKLEEAKELDGRPAKLIWWVEPVETTKKGLEILSMVGGPEALPVFTRALDSPIPTIRLTAIQASMHMAYEAEPLLPTLTEALHDPEYRAPALSTLQGLFIFMTGEHRKRSDPEPSEPEWAAIVARWQTRIETEQIPRSRTRTTETPVGHGG
ncbi:MAG: hypothetical protein GY946_30570 [bacterium]|nr:hypothetical protein [bacterium]